MNLTLYDKFVQIVGKFVVFFFFFPPFGHSQRSKINPQKNESESNRMLLLHSSLSGYSIHLLNANCHGMIEVLLWEEPLTVNLRIIKYYYCCSVTES